jgi:hypothetical protein
MHPQPFLLLFPLPPSLSSLHRYRSLGAWHLSLSGQPLDQRAGGYHEQCDFIMCLAESHRRHTFVLPSYCIIQVFNLCLTELQSLWSHNTVQLYDLKSLNEEGSAAVLRNRVVP